MLGYCATKQAWRAGRVREKPLSEQTQGGKRNEEGNLLGGGCSCEHGGDRGARRSAGGERPASTAERAGKGAGSAAIHGGSGRPAGTAGSSGQSPASERQRAATRPASERKCAGSTAERAGKGAGSAGLHAISGRPAGTA